MDQKRLEETRKKVNNAKEVGLTGWNLAAAVYDEYCEIVPELMDYIAEMEQKQIPRKLVAPLTFGSIGTCPICSAAQVVKRNYCYNCGQKLNHHLAEEEI